jgi:phytol kinase
LGIVPGYYDPISSAGSTATIETTSNDVVLNVVRLCRDVGSTLLTGLLGYWFVQINTYAVTNGSLPSRDARKIIHTLSAPLFIVLWPLFSAATPSSRYFAAIVPILNGIRLYIASMTTTSNDNNNNNNRLSDSELDLAQAISRSGNRNEALGGPFIYVIMLLLSILCFWKDTPHGIIAMSTLAAGDGMADLIGRRFGTNNQWPNSRKSIAGSAAFVIASTITSLGLVQWLQYTNCMILTQSTTELLFHIVIISFVTAFVELIPWLGDDNYTIPISAALLSMLLIS